MMKKNLFVTLAVATLAGAMLMGCTSNAADQATEVVETEADVVVEDEETPLADAVEEDAEVETEADADAETEVEAEAAEYETVEAFYTAEDNKAQLDASLDLMKEAFSEVYSNIEFNVTGNEIEYVYTVAEGVELDADTLQAQMDASMTEETIADAYAAIEAECGVAPEKMTHTYKTADDEVIATFEY